MRRAGIRHQNGNSLFANAFAPRTTGLVNLAISAGPDPLGRHCPEQQLEIVIPLPLTGQLGVARLSCHRAPILRLSAGENVVVQLDVRSAQGCLSMAATSLPRRDRAL